MCDIGDKSFSVELLRYERYGRYCFSCIADIADIAPVLPPTSIADIAHIACVLPNSPCFTPPCLFHLDLISLDQQISQCIDFFGCAVPMENLIAN